MHLVISPKRNSMKFIKNKIGITIILLVFFFNSCKLIYADGNPPGNSNDFEYKKISETLPIITAQTKYEDNFINKLLWSIIGGLIGALIALFLDKKIKSPLLKIVAYEDANQDHSYPNMGGRWKFFRVKVVNKSLPKWINWFCDRNTAQQVNAKIHFTEIEKTMKGRWANTLELPGQNQSDIIRLVTYPEPQTIYAGESEFLDVFVKCENDKEAYGWNNEAYLNFNNWRTSNYILQPGDYYIEIALSGINCQIKKRFKAHISETIDQSFLKNI